MGTPCGACNAMWNIDRKRNEHPGCCAGFCLGLLMIFVLGDPFWGIFAAPIARMVLAKSMHVNTCHPDECFYDTLCIIFLSPCWVGNTFRSVGHWSDGDACGRPVSAAPNTSVASSTPGDSVEQVSNADHSEEEEEEREERLEKK